MSELNNPFKRWNKLRSDLSKHAKSSGYPLAKGQFNEINKAIFQQTKELPYKEVVKRFDSYFENVAAPDIPLDTFNYWDFEGDQYKKILTENLRIDGMNITGSIYKGSDHSYGIYRGFVDWVNKNKDNGSFDDPEYGIWVRLEEPVWNEKDKIWDTRWITCTEDGTELDIDYNPFTGEGEGVISTDREIEQQRQDDLQEEIEQVNQESESETIDKKQLEKLEAEKQSIEQETIRENIKLLMQSEKEMIENLKEYKSLDITELVEETKNDILDNRKKIKELKNKLQ